VKVGVVVLDFGRPADAERAAASARDPGLDPRVLVVENGAAGTTAPAADRLRLSENRGFAGGMNAGIEALLAGGCDRILLLNNDAVLEPSCLRRLAEALEDPALGAVGPVIVREADGRVESRGLAVDLRRGRVRMEGHGEDADDRTGLVPAEALSGAALMIARGALERVGPLDPAYFFSFEDVDWCVRARRAGFALAVVLGARARHASSRTIGRASPDRLYYAARNHLRLVETLEPATGLVRLARRAAVLGLNLALALRQREVPRGPAWRAVREGLRDARQGRFGPRRV
jgi:GT2 family glycosyltransferase